MVGIGGAGKTAIADRFLSELRHGASTTGAMWPSVFVYSFFEDDKPENFFRHLQIWLEGTSAVAEQKPSAQLMFHLQQHRGLMILDGLETVQESGARGEFGRLTSPSLRDLLNHIACGSARDICVLVTSRFPLTDLHDNQPRFFHTIAVEQIELLAGIALLRARGVHGSDFDLAAIVEHCGRHALTVALAGGYIAEYGNGNPATPLDLRTAGELEKEVDRELDLQKRAVLMQGARFAQIAGRYREAMQRRNEAALTLLQRICLFRLGVTCETLARIFTGPKAEKISGKALAKLSVDQLRKELDWLVHMGIVEAAATQPTQQDCPILYTVHPAVRDSFLRELSQTAASSCHRAIREGLNALLPGDFSKPVSLVERLLGGLPGAEFPADPSILDLLEEIIYHALESGQTKEAWDIFLRRIGGLSNLCHRLGNYERGARICRAFLPSVPEPPAEDESKKIDPESAKARLGESSKHIQALDVIEAAELLNYMAAFANHLGDLQSAIVCRQWMVILLPNHPLAWEALTSLAHEIGNLLIAKKRCQHALSIAPKSAHAARDLYAKYASLLTDTGKLVRASHYHKLAFDSARAMATTVDHHISRVELPYVSYLQALRRYKQANEILTGLQAGTHCVNCQTRLLVAKAWKDLHAQNFAAARSQAYLASDRKVQHGSPKPYSLLVQIELEEARSTRSPASKQLASALLILDEGIRFYRSRGYGINHIDLLLDRARLYLLKGEAQAALDDIEVALDTGILPDEIIGQVELPAATHKQCGYAWAIPAGLQLRAEAILLQASNELVALDKAFVSTGKKPRAIDVESVCKAHPRIGRLISDAKRYLRKALDRWHGLRDPEPIEGNNFIDPKTHKEYNHKAAETYRVLADLEAGILTRYSVEFPPELLSNRGGSNETAGIVRDQVFVSYSHEDRKWLDRLRAFLRPLVRNGTINLWADPQISTGKQWKDEITRALAGAKIVVLLVSPHFLNSDFIIEYELPAILAAERDGALTVVWVLVSHCLYEETEIKNYEAAYDPKRPLNTMVPAARDRALTAIAREIRDAANL